MVRIRGAESGMFPGLVRGYDLKVSGAHLTNRDIYMYLKECIVVKSHQSGEVIEKNCPTVDFAEDLEESDGDISPGTFRSFLKRTDALFKFGTTG